MDPLRNPKDPLRDRYEAERELFRRLSVAAGEFPIEHVLAAAANLLVNAIRQEHARSREAADAFDRLAARAKTLLLDKHYDATGKRRNVFPFHQVVEMPLFDARPKH